MKNFFDRHVQCCYTCMLWRWSLLC